MSAFSCLEPSYHTFLHLRSTFVYSHLLLSTFSPTRGYSEADDEATP
uniref:Uncharacterized protein n=1 Tax=Arundo donax TaxID=35708 RepID=A0A0A8ZVC1_ARUDO